MHFPQNKFSEVTHIFRIFHAFNLKSSILLMNNFDKLFIKHIYDICDFYYSKLIFLFENSSTQKSKDLGAMHNLLATKKC